MVPIIRAILENLIGKEEADRMEIVANEVDTSKGSGPGEWTIKYRHPESSVLIRKHIFAFGGGRGSYIRRLIECWLTETSVDSGMTRTDV